MSKYHPAIEIVKLMPRYSIKSWYSLQGRIRF